MSDLGAEFKSSEGNEENGFSIEEEHGMNFLSELLKEVLKELGERQNTYVAEKNVLVFSHGTEWSGYTQKENASERWKGGFQTRSSEVAIPWRDLLTADFSLLDRFKVSLTDSMSSNFEASFLEEIGESTRDQPPINLELNGDIRPGILEMWRTIKLGLNEDLTLSMPHLAMHPQAFEKFKEKAEALEKSDPDFTSEIQKLKFQKWREALIAHFENLRRFKIDDNEREYIEHQLRQLRESSEPKLHQDGCFDGQGELVEE